MKLTALCSLQIEETGNEDQILGYEFSPLYVGQNTLLQTVQVKYTPDYPHH